MDQDQIRDLLEGVRAGSVDVNAALERFRHLPFEDLGYAKLDHHRALRQGASEVILGQGKTVPVEIVADGSDSKTASIASGYAAQIMAEFSQRRLTAQGVRIRGPGIDARVRVLFNPTLRSVNAMIPGLAAIFVCDQGWPQKTMITITAGLFSVGLCGTVLITASEYLSEDIQNVAGNFGVTCFSLFGLGVIGSQFAANYLMSVTVRKY